MGLINRNEISSVVITSFLTLLRNNLTDVCSPNRTNSKWIRSDLQYNKKKLNKSTSSKGHVHISKPKRQVGFPQIVVGNADETNILERINGGFRTEYELIIRVVDNGFPQRIDSLATDIGYTIHNNRSSLIAEGYSNITYDIVPIGEYTMDDSIYNEKDVIVSFKVRTTDAS